MSNTNLTTDKLVGFRHKREISFTWHTGSNVFSIDNDALKEVLLMANDISNIDEFLDLFSEQDKKSIVGMLKKILGGQDPEPIKVFISTDNASVSLSVLTIKQMSGNLIAGVLMPLFLSPTQEDLSSFFHQLFENKHHGVLITDDETRIIACNTLFEKISGYRIDELVGKKTSIFNANKHGTVFFQDMWKKIHSQGSWSGLILSKSKSGNISPQELLIQKIVSIRNNTYYLSMTQDLSNKLYRVAGVEHGGIELLTQLPGEEEFSINLQDTLKNLDETQGLMVVSFVPNFEKSQEFEHKKQLASALAYHENDYSAGFLKKSVFSIAITYSRSKDKPHSLSIFEAIRKQFNTIKQRVDNVVFKKMGDCTIGVSVLGMDANNERRLLSHSLQAMYEKHSSNNTNICFFNRALHEKAKTREIQEQIIRDAVENKTIEVFFQPIICTQSWEVKKLEALCRFKGQDDQILNTQDMIQVAEDLGLISALDLTMADKALSSRDKLVELFGPDVEITINVSLNSDKPIKGLFNDLMFVFKKHIHHLPFVTVELTESAYFNSEQKDSNLLFKLRKKGLNVAIDDFGTGYSSFSYLKDGNFDLLKIDRDFITNLTIGSNNYYIVKMITHLAHTLDVKVVAEGVESIQEVNILKELRVDYLQGFYFEKPMPIEQLSSDINMKSKIKDLVDLDVVEVELISYPPMLSPRNTLHEIKELFDTSDFTVLPVVVDKKCVGIVTREQYNLHATPSLGTDRETMQDYRSLTKSASAMMDTKLKLVHESINDGEIHEKIRNNLAFPWTVIDDEGNYVGVIDSKSAIQFLNEQ
ncbi:EAL domain-containing protein [Vibrio sp. TH_r3]|uniref:sensor domain-containing phosphodiesterase n=1 Tax=Vibrio sp. TH_r3 TaxID=3082084 RepID=UPI00295564E5|nr:EAL domain-containing protein [Vibrio sp. TH_r3]MDV7103589.1 EAL domain-containing protein [Vibrio sp. TH_r3]